jgi:replicative DNA helicase
MRDQWAEDRVLAVMVDDASQVPTCLDALGHDPGVFDTKPDQLLFAAIVALHEAGTDPNYATLCSYLQQRDEFEMVGGLHRLKALFAMPMLTNASNLEYYLGQVTGCYQRRMLQRAAEALWSDAADGGKVEHLVEDAHTALQQLHRAGPTEDTSAGALFDTLYDKLSNPEKDTRLPLRPEALAEMVPTLNPGDLIVVAGNTSAGKSALAMNIAWLSCFPEKRPCLYLSLEMTEQQVIERVTSMLSGVSLGRITHPEGLVDRDWPRISETASAFEAMPFHVVYEPVMSIEQATNIARGYHNRYGSLGVVVLDYLQYMRSDTRDSRNEEISKYSVRMKSLAGELKTSVILVSQLNRQADGSVRPELSHLRDSGSIEQDADVVMMIEKPGLDDGDGTLGAGKTRKVYVRKNRQGEVGDVDMTFLPNVMRWD